MEGNEILLKPGQQIKPHVPNEVLTKLVLKLFNYEVVSVKELNSYDDKNFHIKVKHANGVPDVNDGINPDGYVLKVVNSLDSKALDLIDAQVKMLLHLGKKGISCPQPIQTASGDWMVVEKLHIPVSKEWLENNDPLECPTEEHVVRLLTYLPGEILYTVPYTKELLFQVGELVAKTDVALMDFHHDGIKSVDRIWNLSSVPKLTDFAYVIEDKSKHSMLMDIIQNFQNYVCPRLAKLESGPIHGDFNEQNILVKVDENDPTKHVLAGVLDFGDIQNNYYVFEIAIATCYLILECTTMNFLDAPGHVLAGYNSVRKLPDEEFDLLQGCISARLCQSLILGAYSYSQNPDPYVLTTSKKGWDRLKAIWECPKDELQNRWRSIMSSYRN